jgi:hypothetical protein
MSVLQPGLPESCLLIFSEKRKLGFVKTGRLVIKFKVKILISCLQLNNQRKNYNE